MKKKIIFIAVSVMLLLCLTVNAMAIKVGTTEYDKPLGCQNTKKVVVSSSNGNQVKKLKDVTARAYFDGKKTLHLSYSKSYSGSASVNGSVGASVCGAVNVSTGYSFSWTAGEVSGYSWDITKGDKKGYYNIQYKKSFKKYPYKLYTRNSSIFYTEPWPTSPSKTGTILDGGNAPYFALGYSAN